MDRRVTPLKRVISYLTYLGSPSSMALRFDEISPRSLSSRSDLSGRNIFHLGEISSVSRPRSLSSRADLRDITKSRRDLVKNSARSRLTRRNLRVITNFAELLARSRQNLVYLAAISETLQISPSFSLISTRSLSSRRVVVAI